MNQIKITHLLLVLTIVVALFSSCTSYKQVPYLQQVEPSYVDSLLPARPLYDARIMPKDLLTIVVSCPEEPALAVPFNLVVPTAGTNYNGKGISTYSQPVIQQYLVDNEGCIDFPVLGHLHIGGLTKGETEKLIREKLRPQFKEEPIVTVRMVNYKISVLGEVARPGTFTISNEKVNLFEALAMAGDMTIYGMRQNVQLIREDAEGHPRIVLLNLNDRDIVHSDYYYLQQNDIVYVTPNKTKAKNSSISTSNTIWFSVIGSLVSMISLIVAITK